MDDEVKTVDEVVDTTSVEDSGPKLTFVGEGSVKGSYMFAELSGTVAANSLEEAYAKAREIVTKQPDLLLK